MFSMYFVDQHTQRTFKTTSKTHGDDLVTFFALRRIHNFDNLFVTVWTCTVPWICIMLDVCYCSFRRNVIRFIAFNTDRSENEIKYHNRKV